MTLQMESIMTIESTALTPYVMLDSQSGILEFRGRSSPGASLEFYYPIMSKIDQVFTNGNKSITANFAFEYFNTSTSKCLFDILKRLVQLHSAGMQVAINWMYEEDDEDMRETGEDYADILGAQFNFVVI